MWPLYIKSKRVSHILTTFFDSGKNAPMERSEVIRKRRNCNAAFFSPLYADAEDFFSLVVQAPPQKKKNTLNTSLSPPSSGR
jgi:hypothetical protein